MQTLAILQEDVLNYSLAIPSMSGLLGWVYTRVQDQRKYEFERSYWLRAKLWTQGVYTRVQVKGMKKWRGTNVASLSCQISVIPTQENTSPGLGNQSSSLGPILSLKVRFIKVCSGPQVYLTWTLMWTHAWVLPCLQDFQCADSKGTTCTECVVRTESLMILIKQCSVVTYLYMRIYLWNLWLIRGLCAPCPINVDITCACGQTVIQVHVKPSSCRLCWMYMVFISLHKCRWHIVYSYNNEIRLSN